MVSIFTRSEIQHSQLFLLLMLLITRTNVAANLSWFLVINISYYFICLPARVQDVYWGVAQEQPYAPGREEGKRQDGRGRQAVLKPKLICLKTWFYDRLIICMPLKLYFRYYRLICKLYVHTYIFFLLQK